LRYKYIQVSIGIENIGEDYNAIGLERLRLRDLRNPAIGGRVVSGRAGVAALLALGAFVVAGITLTSTGNVVVEDTVLLFKSNTFKNQKLAKCYSQD